MPIEVTEFGMGRKTTDGGQGSAFEEGVVWDRGTTVGDDDHAGSIIRGAFTVV